MEQNDTLLPEDTELPEEERPEESPSAEQSAMDFQGLGTKEQPPKVLNNENLTAEPTPPDPLTELDNYERLLARAAAEINIRKNAIARDSATNQISLAEALILNNRADFEAQQLQQQYGQLHQQRTSIQSERAAKKEQETLSLIPQWVDENVAKTEVNIILDHLSKRDGRTVTREELGRMSPQEIKNVRDETVRAVTEKSARQKELEGKLKAGKRLTTHEQIELGDARMAHVRAEKERHEQLFPKKEKPAAKQEPSYADHWRREFGDHKPSRNDILRAIREGRV